VVFKFGSKERIGISQVNRNNSGGTHENRHPRQGMLRARDKKEHGASEEMIEVLSNLI
jgi:hypothetical protein